MESQYQIQQHDIEETVKNLPILNELEGRHILVTGATGLLGTYISKVILCFNRLYGKNIHIIVNGRSHERIKDVYNHQPVHEVIGDVCSPIVTDLPVDYIIHCASITSSQAFVNTPVDTIKTLLLGTYNLLELAKQKRVKGFLYISSLEIYGIPFKFNVKEDDYGYIDILNARSSYSEGKRMAECMCRAYAEQFEVPTRIARLTQTIGPGIAYDDNRVFAQFARSVIERKDIVLNTAGRTVRSYCDISDAVRAIITILLKGKTGEAYNIANPKTEISIADLATFVCDQNPDSGIKVIFSTPDNLSSLGYNPEMKISLCIDKIQKLGWTPRYGLKEIFQKLINGLNEQRKRI